MTYPSNMDQRVHSTTVNRGDVVERTVTSRGATQAAHIGERTLDVTQIILEDYRIAA
ncbi:hypothetical protein [Xanthobacter sp. 91]|uniref:hypothetical protein n=1 Tax=Xanthobacter sp. 91 TaxID=1117244 RepID=UPI0012DED106|nr:hypothetical protein [Xanthobacter sp. 91]